MVSREDKTFLSYCNKQTLPVIRSVLPSSLKQNDDCSRRQSNFVDLQFQKMKLCPGIRFYDEMVFVVDGWGLVLRLKLIILQMFPWIPLKFQDDDKWLHPAEESDLPLKHEMENGDFQLANIRQPPPPPVLAQVQQELLPLSPSRVANPRSRLQEVSQDGLLRSKSYQDLHISVKMMEDFLRLARENTLKNLETCGVLAGSLRNRVFHITMLIIPKQESTSDSCQTLNEEEIFEVQNKSSLFPLGWIHTHPTQTCFMSSVDLHTHYSYQVMLPEAIAIVMAPTDTSSPHGIFHLFDPSGVAVIRNCQQRGFHPHEEPEDGSPIYEHCSHVYINPNLKFNVIDLR